MTPVLIWRLAPELTPSAVAWGTTVVRTPSGHSFRLDRSATSLTFVALGPERIAVNSEDPKDGARVELRQGDFLQIEDDIAEVWFADTPSRLEDLAATRQALHAPATHLYSGRVLQQVLQGELRQRGETPVQVIAFRILSQDRPIRLRAEHQIAQSLWQEFPGRTYQPARDIVVRIGATAPPIPPIPLHIWGERTTWEHSSVERISRALETVGEEIEQWTWEARAGLPA